jgi:predicted ATPase
VKRFVLTGAPGCGKTSVLLELRARGYAVVREAATDVIGAEQQLGVDQPWAHPWFIDKIVNVQRARQLQPVAARRGVQIYDRSPVCTLALTSYLGYPVSAALSAEIDRIEQQGVYDRRVFFVRDLGFCAPTAARRISFDESLRFERVHDEVYRALGYELVDVPRAGVAARVDMIEMRLAAWTGRQRDPGE